MSRGLSFLLYPQYIFDTLVSVFNKKFLPYFFTGVIGILISVFYIFAINPEESFLLFDFSLSPIPFLFFLLFISTTSLCVYILKNLRRGILIGVFVGGILLLRLFEFNNILYTILLLIILALVEFIFLKRSN